MFHIYYTKFKANKGDDASFWFDRITYELEQGYSKLIQEIQSRKFDEDELMALCFWDFTGDVKRNAALSKTMIEYILDKDQFTRKIIMMAEFYKGILNGEE